MPRSLFRPGLVALALSFASACVIAAAATLPPSSASSATAAATADAQDDIFDTPAIIEDREGTMPGRPNLSEPRPVAPALKVIREGTRFVERSGRIERSEGQTFFIFDAPELPRLALLPSRFLELLEETSAYGKRSVRFNISGQVSEYRGKNFLRLDVNPQPAQPARGEPVEPVAARVPAARSDSAAHTAPALPPRDRDLPPSATSRDIPALPQPEPAARPAAPAPATPAGAAPAVLVREGKRIVEQDGRVVRAGDQTSFVFDSGDTPVLVLPNLKLALMEDLADFGRRPVRFRISGVMTEYHGRNYLFMTKMVVIPKFSEKL